MRLITPVNQGALSVSKCDYPAAHLKSRKMRLLCFYQPLLPEYPQGRTVGCFIFFESQNATRRPYLLVALDYASKSQNATLVREPSEQESLDVKGVGWSSWAFKSRKVRLTANPLGSKSASQLA
jgi:hypothetical protein